MYVFFLQKENGWISYLSYSVEKKKDKEQNEQNFERKQKATLNQHLPEKSLVVNLCF